MDALNIGQLARQTGMRASAIRYYESIGLLRSPERIGSWRTFDSQALDRLRVIQAARALGFALEEIRVLLDGFPEDTPPPRRWRELAEQKLPEVEAMIARATAMKRLLEAGLRCECISVEECFDTGCEPDRDSSCDSQSTCASDDGCGGDASLN